MGKCMRMVYIYFAVRKNPWSISFGGVFKLSSLTVFTHPERYYIELSTEVLTMNLAEEETGIFGCQKTVISEVKTSQVFLERRCNFHGDISAWKGSRKVIDPSSESSFHCLNKNREASFR